ncbi:MAG TPA: hypothetical protein EYP20_01600 [Aigarchaeota archaeon]|nr:hypothetical protein [Aigarchaeota archaeon]
MEEEKALLETIHKLRLKRDAVRYNVSLLKARIKRYRNRARNPEYARKLKLTKEELERTMKEYEELKAQINALVEKWKKTREGKPDERA